ncbi:hypothetical protein N7528_003989 [Penicillium herquei]|nr:hypothetical protein N7528_003989 [Penicillium herquei]
MLSSPSSTNASKRKAGDEMTSPPVRRLRLSAPESSLPPDPPPTGRKTAEPDSIHAILQDHCRTRLYVPPVAWTETQLQLLECQFDQKFSTKRRSQYNQRHKGLAVLKMAKLRQTALHRISQ